MNTKPFNGNGIPSDLNESSSKLYNDEYFQLLKKTYDHFEMGIYLTALDDGKIEGGADKRGDDKAVGF